MSWEEEVKGIKKREKLSLKQGGKESIKIQHQKGRKTIRERIDFHDTATQLVKKAGLKSKVVFAKRKGTKAW